MQALSIVNGCVAIMSNAVQASINGQFEQSSNYPTKQIMETLGDILADNDVYGATLIQQGLLPFLQAVYFDKNNDDQLLRLEVIFCWMNISGGRNSQLLFDTGIFPTLVENVTALTPAADALCYEAARRSMVVICNFICECSDSVRVEMMIHGRRVSSCCRITSGLFSRDISPSFRADGRTRIMSSLWIC